MKVLFLILSIRGYSQRDSLAMFSAGLENDCFFKTDRYYTNGISFQLRTPVKDNLQKSFVINHEIFTGSHIKSLLPGDRPYGAFLTAQAALKRYSKTSYSEFSGLIGVSGEPAGSGLQNGFHRLTENAIVKGWDYQIRSYYFANISATMGKEIKKILRLSATAQAGTYKTGPIADIKFYPGLTKGNCSAHILLNLNSAYYFHNSTLQGNIFNEDPNAIQPEKINKLQSRASAGIELQFKKLFGSIIWTVATPEMENLPFHKWGGITIGKYF